MKLPITDSTYQRIFSMSKVNGADYRGEEIAPQHWEWPKETWLRKRMAELAEREDQHDNHRDPSPSSSRPGTSSADPK